MPDSPVSAIYSTIAGECTTLLEDAEEFLMDTEEHRRILAQNPFIAGRSLQKGAFCSTNDCPGLFNAKNRRGCVNTCDKGH